MSELFVGPLVGGKVPCILAPSEARGSRPLQFKPVCSALLCRPGSLRSRALWSHCGFSVYFQPQKGNWLPCVSLCLPSPRPPGRFPVLRFRLFLPQMSGKAGSTSIRFPTYRLQSRMCQRPRRTPAKWPEVKAEVDPTEEKGAPHPFLPSRGDLCLLRSTQTSKAASIVAV